MSSRAMPSKRILGRHSMVNTWLIVATVVLVAVAMCFLLTGKPVVAEPVDTPEDGGTAEEDEDEGDVRPASEQIPPTPMQHI